MDVAEKDFVSIIHAHWVDKANGQDLDNLGALISTERKVRESDTDYRNRLKISVLRSRGGTLESVKAAARLALNLPQDYPITINENPEVKRIGIYNVKSGGSWKIDLQDMMSVKDAPLDITITVKTEWGKIQDPRIINLDSKDSITFRGDIAYGDILRITNRGKALLNGKDETASLKIPGIRRPYREIQRITGESSGHFELPNLKVLTLPRGGSKWMLTFNEIVWAEKGIFDKSHFDKSYFLLGERSSITFEYGIFDKSQFDRSYFLLDEEPFVTSEYGIFDKSHFDKSYFLLDEGPSITFEYGTFDKSHLDESYFLLDEEPFVTFEYGIFDKSHFDKSYFLLDEGPSVTFDGGIFDKSHFDRSYFLLDQEPVVTFEGGRFDESRFDRSYFLMYEESSITFEGGIFDKSHFDKSYFLLDAEISVTFEWMARQSARFELEITKKLIIDAGITNDKLIEVLNTVKASGVRADLKVTKGNI